MYVGGKEQKVHVYVWSSILPVLKIFAFSARALILVYVLAALHGNMTAEDLCMTVHLLHHYWQ